MTDKIEIRAVCSPGDAPSPLYPTLWAADKVRKGRFYRQGVVE